MQYAKDNTIAMDDRRKKAIKEWLKLQEDFKKLSEKGLVTHIIINKSQQEIDIDKLEEGFDISKATDEEKEKLPKIEREYLQYLLLVRGIYEGMNGKERCIDNFDTETIELFNERIKTKVDTYKDFIK